MTGRSRILAAVAATTAVLALSACGGASDGAGSADPVSPVTPAAAAAPSGPLVPGAVVTAGEKTPKVVARALKAGKPIVVTFVLGGIADDDAVRAAVRQVSKEGPSARGVVYATFDVAARRDFGDLPARLDVRGTPTVVVIGRDGEVVNVWTGLVDAAILRQSVARAQEAVPR
jgi:hypothetical protein